MAQHMTKQPSYTLTAKLDILSDSEMHNLDREANCFTRYLIETIYHAKISSMNYI